MEKCIYCQISEQEVPLVLLTFHGRSLCICPQHLPILIHKPEQLAEILAGIGGGDIPVSEDR